VPQLRLLKLALINLLAFHLELPLEVNLSELQVHYAKAVNRLCHLQVFILFEMIFGFLSELGFLRVHLARKHGLLGELGREYCLIPLREFIGLLILGVQDIQILH
jgi:hypothetical protein